MLALARDHDRFLMEAMWMACHPVIRAVADGVQAGRFGTPRQLHADLGFVVERPPGDRMLDPALGAGALLDMGIYPLTVADLVLGPATTLAATAVLDDRGVDVDVAVAGRARGRRGLGPHGLDDLGLATDRDPGHRRRPHRPARRLPPPGVRRLDAARRRAGADRGARARSSAPGSATRRPRSPGASPRGCARARWSPTTGPCACWGRWTTSAARWASGTPPTHPQGRSTGA